MDKKTELEILHLIAIKNEITAKANRELDCGGWLSDHDGHQKEISMQINKLLNNTI